MLLDTPYGVRRTVLGTVCSGKTDETLNQDFLRAIMREASTGTATSGVRHGVMEFIV